MEDAGQGVVVSRGKGIELVIVAARAGNGLPEEGAPDSVNLVINDIRVELSLDVVLQGPGTDREVQANCPTYTLNNL